MSRSGATVPPPGLGPESSTPGNAGASSSSKPRSESGSKPRQNPNGRSSRNKPKAEETEPSSSSRKQRATKKPSSESTSHPHASSGAARKGKKGNSTTTTKTTAAPSPSTTATTTKQQTSSSRRRSSTGRGDQRNQQSAGRRKPIFKQHLSLDDLMSGLDTGAFFRAKLRCNPGDRSQGFCTVPGLPHDVFIPDWKPQNRAIEGDEVVIQILPLEEWRNQNQSGGGGGGGGRGNRRKSRGRESSATPPMKSESTTTSNILPFASASSSFATTTATPALAGGGHRRQLEEGEEEEVTSRILPLTPITPPTIEIGLDDEEEQCEEGDYDEPEVVSELIAAPALMPSPSGGELPFSMEHSPLGLEGADELEEEEEEHDLSMVGFVTEKLQTVNLQEDISAITTPAPAPANTALLMNANQRPWADATTPSQAIATVASLLSNEMQGWRATGEVVGIMQRSERRNALVGVLKSYGNEIHLIPRDPRLPLCLVAHASLKSIFDKETVDMLVRESRQEKVPYRTLLAAHIVSWDTHLRYPDVDIQRIVGQAGGLDVEIEALLTQERIHDDDQFTPEVLACLPAVPWSVAEADVAERRDFRSLRIFSIDPPTARDLDDALSIEELPNGLVRIGVHIADVSHFVTPSTALDEEAAVRSTSVYLVDRVIPMLPRLLCEELCSLNPGVDRLAFSIVWEMDLKGNIQSTWAGRSIICSCGKLSYPQVQELIDGTATPEGPQPEGVQLHGSAHSWGDVARDALKLHSVASEMRRRRFEVDGALRLDNARLFFEMDDQGKAIEYGIYQQKEANRLVEEFMLAANMSAARIISAAFPDRALLRRHMPPNSHKLQELAATVARLLPNAPTLDVSSAGALQRSLSALKDSVGPEIAEVVTLMCTKPMQTAQYFCTGDQNDPSLWRHYALAVGHYTHFTSPIRRYPDVLVHRLLQAALDKEEREKNNDTNPKNDSSLLLLDTKKVSEIALHANERKTAAKAAQDGALKLYLASLLLDRPGVFNAVVIGLGGSRFFDAYVPGLGIDVRVHTDRIVKGGEAALDLDWNDEAKILKIDVKVEKKETSAAAAIPVYDDVENFDKLHNPKNVEKITWPIELRSLCTVPVVVCGARSKSSGSPAGVHAKNFV